MSGYTWLTGDGPPDPPEQHEDEDMIDKVYPEVDSQQFPEEYMRHVNAMTMEGLHRKSEIAAQLAWRDVRIAAKDAEIAALKVATQELADQFDTLRSARDAEIAELRAAVALAEARYDQANKLHLEEMDGHMRTNLAMLDAITERDEAQECVRRLYKTLASVAQLSAWTHFGEHRSFAEFGADALLSADDADIAAKKALFATPEHLRK